MDSNEKYKNIINLKRPKSQKHFPMTMIDRAAQFSPFAALTGYDAAVKETARLTQEKIELDDSEKEIISERINAILESTQRFAQIKYFVKDKRKSGGRYVSIDGNIKKFDDFKRCLKMDDGLIIYIDDILEIDSPVFNFI